MNKLSRGMKKNAASALMISSLMLLPSCGFIDWLKEKFGRKSSGNGYATSVGPVAQDGSAVLATIHGKPLITKKMLDEEKNKLLESNPQLQAMISLMDGKQLDRNLVDGMTSREIIRKYIADNKVDSSDKYRKDFDTVIHQVRDALNTRYFMESFAVSVNDGEVKKFYEENKETIPNLLVSRGGIETMAVPFSDEAQAKEFAGKVRANKNDIMRVAKEAGIASRVKDFKLVNDQSIGIEPALRDRVVAIKSTPSTHTFKIGKENWVVAAVKKEQPQYRALDQVKDEIRQLLEKDKTMKRFEEEVARLRNEYGIELVEEFFKNDADNARAVQAEAGSAQDATAKSVDASDTHPASAHPTTVV